MMTAFSTAAPTLAPQDEAAIRAIVAGLEASWNAANGEEYGAYFAADADFVNIYGFQAHGREAIAAGHQQIFNTVYRGSHNRGELTSLRLLRADVALAHVRWHLRLADEADERAALGTLAFARQGDEWQIAAFHNTLVAPPMGRS